MSKMPPMLAFPSECSDGMTLRDYFAGQALMTLYAAHGTSWTDHEITEAAYDIADMMMEARKK